MRPLTTLFLSLLLCSPLQSQTDTGPMTLAALRTELGSGQERSGALPRQVERLFGRQNLLKGRAVAKVEGTTVAWAIMESKPARVIDSGGAVIGQMSAVGSEGLQVLVKEMPNFTDVEYRVEIDGMPRAGGSVRIEHFSLTRDSEYQPGVPAGRLERFQRKESKVFPGTVRDVTVYIPRQYEPGSEACLMVWQDGTRHVDPRGGMKAGVVFDNLIHKGEMPVTIGVFVDPGRKANQKAGDKAANRSVEYDSLGGAYAEFLLEEILPEVRERYNIKFREAPEAWAIAGGSSGGICAFTAAWERPDKFRKVLCWVGTFVDIRGGNAYPYLVRIAERKPIRVYLLDGTNDLDNKYGNWPLANRMMEASLKYMGYDYRMDWTQCFHGSKGMAPALPDALRWLWRDVR